MLPKGMVNHHTRVAVLYWDTDSAVVGATLSEVPGSGVHGSDRILTVP